MTKYYVNKNAQSNGDHEVHTQYCNFLPEWQNRKKLGNFSNCHQAVRKAKEIFNQVNGCKHCSEECHTT